jgi:hypothetical protein
VLDLAEKERKINLERGDQNIENLALINRER